MQIPILKQGFFLIISIQTIVGDKDLIDLKEDLAVKVGEHRSKGVIIDVTTLDVLDSFSTKTLQNIAATVRLRGAETVIVGIQPEVAFAMVELGLKLNDIKTALNLEEGMLLLNNYLKEKDNEL